MIAFLAAAGPSPLWFLTRGTGVVSLLLLTSVVLLGIASSTRWQYARWPRFLTAGLHRNVTLLVLTFLTVHIATTVADPFAPIRLQDAVLPFASSYRPIWLGLGALAFDLLLALVATSLLRARVGLRAWRLLHWLAYAAWPVALVHGLGTGSDAKFGWMIFLTAVCIASVTLAGFWRLGQNWRSRTPLRAAAALGAAALSLVIGTWYATGPLGRGWAARAGTPRSLLTSSAALASARTTPVGLGGTYRETGPDGAGEVTHTIDALAPGGTPERLRLTLRGRRLPGGGVVLTQSRVTFGPETAPGAFAGSIVALDGPRLLVSLRNRAGSRLELLVTLHIDRTAGTVSGRLRTIAAQPS